MKMFDAVIFDWDWTLADTRKFLINSFQRVLKEIGCEVSDEFIERRIGTGARNTLRDSLKATGIPFNDRTIDELLKRKIEVQMELIESVELFDGTIDLLNSLHNRVKMALATMSNRKVVNKLLDEKNVRKYFDVVITVDEVDQPKPHPEIFLKCVEKLHCEPERCVVIEDSIFGIKAAKEANMKCIAVPTGAYSIDELREEKPDLIVESIKEKEAILNFILNKKCNSESKPGS